MSILKKSLIFLILNAWVVLYGANGDVKTIAFAQDTMANDFRKAQVNEVRDEVALHPNLKFIYSDAKGRTSLLIAQIEKFIMMRVDLIILGTNNEKAVVPVVEKAYKSGISVIVLDRGIQGEQYTTFINSDNIKIGAMGAEFIAKKLGGKGKVLLLEGLQKADVTKLRTKGFMDVIAKYKGIQVIKRTGNYLRKDAIVQMEKLIESDTHIDAIFSQSDSMLSGVRLVMGRHNIDASTVISIGCDFTSEAKEAIKAGTQTASILFPLGGKKSVEIDLKIFANKTVPKHIYNPVKLVTKDNVQSVKAIF